MRAVKGEHLLRLLGETGAGESCKRVQQLLSLLGETGAGESCKRGATTESVGRDLGL